MYLYLKLRPCLAAAAYLLNAVVLGMKLHEATDFEKRGW